MCLDCFCSKHIKWFCFKLQALKQRWLQHPLTHKTQLPCTLYREYQDQQWMPWISTGCCVSKQRNYSLGGRHYYLIDTETDPKTIPETFGNDVGRQVSLTLSNHSLLNKGIMQIMIKRKSIIINQFLKKRTQRPLRTPKCNLYLNWCTGQYWTLYTLISLDS